MTQPGNPFAAVDAALGYFFQVRVALLWTLRRQKSGASFLVSVETLDDVTFETVGGEPVELLQTKHHRSATASLSDASVDLWKTLRIWFETQSAEAPQTASLILVTTATASEASAASHLRIEPRNVEAARERLDATAASSTNQENRRAYEAYLKATPSQKMAVLERVVVIDAAPNIEDLDVALRAEVYWAVEKKYLAVFLERLEGWWQRRVLGQLTGGSEQRIGSVELEARMSDLREQFKQEALPIEDELLDLILDEATAASYSTFTFVRQLELVKLRKSRIRIAIQDYYKAAAQRSRWMRDELVERIDLTRYELRLVDEWTRVFEAMRDEIGETAADSVKEKAALNVLRWAETAAIPIRPNVTEAFVSRGSFHMLADEVRIGWHPDFVDRLRVLLES